MSLASRLKAPGLAAALLAGLIAAMKAEVVTSKADAGPPIDAGIKARPAPIGHRRPHAGGVPRDDGQDSVVRNEEEFDRKFGMCRRC